MLLRPPRSCPAPSLDRRTRLAAPALPAIALQARGGHAIRASTTATARHWQPKDFPVVAIDG